jgi:hypothetical protein
MREQMVALQLDLQKLHAEKDKALAWPRSWTLDREGASVRGGGRRRRRRAGLRAPRRLRRGRRPARAGRPQGRRRRRHRRLFRASRSTGSRPELPLAQEALAELEEAMATRSADYGVWVAVQDAPPRAPALRRSAGTSCSWCSIRRRASWCCRSPARSPAPGC